MACRKEIIETLYDVYRAVYIIDKASFKLSIFIAVLVGCGVFAGPTLHSGVILLTVERIAKSAARETGN